MSQTVRPSSVFDAKRTPFHVLTEDGIDLIGEVASPLGTSKGAILCLHPLPIAGGITVVRFNTRGTTSEAGSSTGQFDNGVSERFDVEAMLRYCFDTLKLENVWVTGWSFGTDLALQHAKEPRHEGLILLSPPLRTTTDAQLEYWNTDPRPVTALVPELDDYLKPAEARARFAIVPKLKVIAVDEAKHLWVGEPAVHRVLSEITSIVNGVPTTLPLEF
jgi:alpha/beta superfamily hydrolase